MQSQPLHFTTQNAPLAFALATVGFRLVAIWNRYTDAALDALKMPTVEAAKAAGKPGNITYAFERRGDLRAALDAWDKAGTALKAGEQIQTKIEAADAIPIVRATMRGHDPFRELWKGVPAIYIQTNEGDAKVDKNDETGGRVEHLPGLRIVSEGVSDEDRATVFRK